MFTVYVRSSTGARRSLVVLSEQFDDAGYLGNRAHRDRHPTRVGQDMVWSGTTCRDQFVANAAREGQVSNGPVQMSQFPPPQPELHSAETVFMRPDPLPGRDLGADRLDRRKRSHDLTAHAARRPGAENRVLG